ncbi:MarR family transcriptional regulator [Nonomuraea soli]|uniref:Uncharacterized protein n=1 Tax=Nonomuraea soli TaxID=1032476 RepID=A0A7W0HWC1_9ACTN|nr:helix-turn-helix domain-containing protein [Nonomuraea soli]MBA2897671.1 hypothetical protein [Nonomuraea soli]
MTQTKNTGPDGAGNATGKGFETMAINIPEMTGTEKATADMETAANAPANVPAAGSVTVPDSPDAATPDIPATDLAMDADERVAAVSAALESLPGGSATGIGAAAGLSRVAAGKVLNQMEAEGLVRREPGVSDGSTKGRAADRWYLTPADPAEPTGAAEASAPAPEASDAEPVAMSAPDTGTDIADDEADDAALPAPEAEVAVPGVGSADPAPADEPTDEEGTGQGTAGADDLNADAEPEVDEPESEPVADDPAWERARAELAELAELFSGILSAKEDGNTVMALGCLEMAMTKVAAAHRTARAALTGTTTPARAVPGAGGGGGIGGSTRSGALRELVHGHLIAFPGKEFTPHEISKALGGRSSGAVANALDRLVQLGEAIPTTERPRRFTLAPTADHGLANAAVAPANPVPANAADTGNGAATGINGH